VPSEISAEASNKALAWVEFNLRPRNCKLKKTRERVLYEDEMIIRANSLRLLIESAVINFGPRGYARRVC
jgi:hypothetical protein